MIAEVVARCVREEAARHPRLDPRDLRKALRCPEEWAGQQALKRLWDRAAEREAFNRGLVRAFVAGRTPCAEPGCLRPGLRCLDGGRVSILCAECQRGRAA